MSFDLLTVDYTQKDAPEKFTESLRQTGFAVVKNHPVSAELIDHVYSDWKKFFSDEKKMDYLFDKQIQEGYFPFKSENAKYTNVKDLKEFYHYFPWGRLPQGMSQHTPELYQQMSMLAGTLLTWIESQLPLSIQKGLSMPMKDMITGSKRTLMRILNYPPIPYDVEENAVRAAEHEDIGMLTLLPAATAKGLQVKDSQGQWHEVPCDYGTIVVNTGDTLTAITQHYLPATTHRVVNPQGELAQQARLSMPLFLHPHDEVALPDGRTAVEYLLQRFKEIGLT